LSSGLTVSSGNVTLSAIAPGSTSCVQINSSGVLSNTGSACGSGSGSVSSVGLSMPGAFTITNSPVTGSGTLTAAWTNNSYLSLGYNAGNATANAVAVGTYALQADTGFDNVGVGYSALTANTGSDNTAVGSGVLS